MSNNSLYRFFIITLSIVFPFLLYAQKISVSHFELAESDLTAQNKKTSIEDQNGDKCALIRIQTTQKGFSFDVGSAGIQKIEDNHIGEIWLYVPFGVRHISIRHPQLGSLPSYDFPITIEKARTYIMEISSDKMFVNYYDDTRKQKLHIKSSNINARFTLNGLKILLDEKGESTQELSFGTYTYKVEADNFHSKEGQITINDSIKSQELFIEELKPITGKISIHTTPENTECTIDNISIPSNTSTTPYPLQIGHHKLSMKRDGYKIVEKDVVIEENRITYINDTLTQVAEYNFSSTPIGVSIKIDGERIGKTPCKRVLETGTYNVCATKNGYKDYKQELQLNSYNPTVNISMKKIYNYKNEFYMDIGKQTGSFLAFGGCIGGYISNINLEFSVLNGTSASETVYWNSTDHKPISSVYRPKLNLCGRIGYSIPVGTRFRLTPQLGISNLTIKEELADNPNTSIIEKCNVTHALLGIRLSYVLLKHIGINVSPEYDCAINKSKGFKKIEEISPKIKKWGQGFNIKFGLTFII